MVDALATEVHYLAHLAPVWHGLDPAERGTFWIAGALADRAGLEGVGEVRVGRPPGGPGPAVLVASFQDHRSAAALGRRTVYLEHGAGQTYRVDAGPHPSYSGSPGHDGTALFLSPSETVAERWRAAYPGVPAVAVGCPRLDGLHCGAVRAAAARKPRPGVSTAGEGPAGLHASRGPGCERPVVAALSFHSQVRLCPETFGAYPAYSQGLRAVVAELVGAGVEVLGHGHPRMWRRLAATWAALDVEPVEDFLEVAARATVYCADNSSTLPEAASLGIPLVWLNAPWYRRGVHHGGRFWHWPAGQVSADSAAQLPEAVLAAAADPPEVRAARQAMVAEVYVVTDGRAAERAVEAIRQFVPVD